MDTTVEIISLLDEDDEDVTVTNSERQIDLKMAEGGGDGVWQPVQLDAQIQQLLQRSLTEYFNDRMQEPHTKDKKTPKKRVNKEPSKKMQSLKKKETDRKAKYEKIRQEVQRARIEMIIENKEKSLKKYEEMRAKIQTTIENKQKDIQKYKEKLEMLKSKE